jgi:integrase
MVQIWESKTNYRECPVSVDTKKKAQMLKNIQGLKKTDSLVDVSTRTSQRWVKDAAEAIADGSKYWEELSAHDLRRTWATHTYWRIDGDRSREVVMSWGGWSDVQTFSESYLGTVPDSVAIDIIQEAELA